MTEDPARALRAMIMGQIVATTVGIAARLGIVDRVADEPRAADEVARDVGAHAPSLHRLMRGLTALDILTEQADGRFGLTPMGELLRDGVPGSMRSMAMLFGGGPHARGWAEAMHSIRTGETVPEGVFGTDVFAMLAEDPQEQAIFDRAMTENTAMMTPEIVSTFDFSRYRTIADIGGGHGLLLASVLQANPGARGILFDAAHVVEGARDVLEDHGVADRCEVVGGDFFETVPNGADLYMMKAIIHDWDDERASAILRNCRAHMDDDDALLVIDRVMPEHITAEDPLARAGTLMDLNMLVLVSGRERKEAEFRALLAASGFALTKVTEMSFGISLIESMVR